MVTIIKVSTPNGQCRIGLGVLGTTWRGISDLLWRRNDFLSKRPTKSTAERARADFSVAGPVVLGQAVCADEARWQRGISPNPAGQACRDAAVTLGRNWTHPLWLSALGSAEPLISISLAQRNDSRPVRFWSRPVKPDSPAKDRGNLRWRVLMLRFMTARAFGCRYCSTLTIDPAGRSSGANPTARQAVPRVSASSPNGGGPMSA